MATTTPDSPTMWERTKGYSNTAYTKALKPGWNKAYAVVDKLQGPANRLSNKVGSEAFWPTSMDKESDKAARILRGFCKDGFYDQIDESQAKKLENRDISSEGIPQGKQRVIKKIPAKVIKQAKGLAIFTTMRTGWVLGGSGGAGILVARHPETGEWSPPSGIQIQNLSVGFLIGVDIYDSVLIINTSKALEAFTKLRCTLGTEVGLAAGPAGIGGTLDTELLKRQAPIWSYVKSRGFYAGIALEGNLVIERVDENERFYGERVGVSDILTGKLRFPPKEKYAMLMATIQAAQGDNVDESLLPEAGQSPSDMELITEGPTFGVPDQDDPDPFGVKALEAEGLNIREAGTHQRPSAEVFEFKPAPTSPIYGHFSKHSTDGSIKRRTWRESSASLISVDRGTQTDEDESKSSNHSPKRHPNRGISPPTKESQHVDDNDQRDETTDAENKVDKRDSDSDVESDAEIHTAVPMVTRARMVTVPKRIPPPLPPRHPDRVGSPSQDDEEAMDGFERIDMNDSTTDSKEPAGREGQEALPAEPNETEDFAPLSKTTSASASHGPEDNFHSIPQTPTEEKKEDKKEEKHDVND